MSKIVTFRCPKDLLSQLDFTADHFNRTRNSVLLAAVRLFARQLNEQHGGQISPTIPAELLTRENMFPKPESKGGRPRKQQPEEQA
jgi:hypothetical protein